MIAVAKAKMIGLKKFSNQIKALGEATGGKALRKSAVAAATPGLKAVRANAPIGDRSHKVYTGRVVEAGFLKKSIGKQTWQSPRKRYVSVSVGNYSEAFYGTDFQERGTVKSQRNKGWASDAFVGAKDQMFERLKKALRINISAATRK